MKSSRIIFIAASLALITPPIIAHAADQSDTSQKTEKHGTGKGAAVGALAGHEMGSGHAAAGAVTGAAVGHHDQSKANKGD